MGKERMSKRQLIRAERKAKRNSRAVENVRAKRQRREGPDADNNDIHEYNDAVPPADGADYVPLDNGHGDRNSDGEQWRRGPSAPEREFFGMLADSEQEYFRSADEKLETNDFDSDEDRGYFLQSLYKEAAGKELKLASSQSCSRLMERLILLSNTRQKKRLFEAFAGHFVTLVTHRFASHCCEKLFIHSAPVVSRELGGMDVDQQEEHVEGEEEAPKASMEELILLTLDELEEHLSYLLSDKYGSHTLRVLLMVLSGRPLEQVATKSLLQSRKKEHISVPGAPTATVEMNAQVRVVPESFTMAMQKILGDTTAAMDTTALRVLATHPTGNPVLQLLVEMDMFLNGKDKEKKDQLLILKLLPDAPDSLSDNSTPASDFVNSMMYDPVGSRLLETIITHAPAKIFKALNSHFFTPRIQTYVRNDTACYPAIKALNRMSKDDLKEAVNKIIPEVPRIVSAKRLNVLKALFDRCKVRKATDDLDALLQAVCSAYGSEDGVNLVPKLCGLEEEEEEKEETEAAPKQEKKFQRSHQSERQKAATISHGCHLATTLLGVTGAPARAIQTSLLCLTTDQLFHLATSTTPSMIVLTTALAPNSPAETPNFHKALVTKLSRRVLDLARSQIGHNVVNAIIALPSKAGPASGPSAPAPAAAVVPFHLKEAIMTELVHNEKLLRETWTGRNVWRTWKGDQWRFRRSDWIRFAKEVDPEVKSEEKVWNRVAEREREERMLKHKQDRRSRMDKAETEEDMR